MAYFIFLSHMTSLVHIAEHKITALTVVYSATFKEGRFSFLFFFSFFFNKEGLKSSENLVNIYNYNIL